MKRIILLTAYFCTSLILIVNAQKKLKYPQVGDKFENHCFYDVKNFNNLPLATDSMKGKWLILDVWGYSCGSCIISFPKMDILHKQFTNRVNIIMVGATKGRGKNRLNVQEQEQVSRDIYNRINQKYSLSIPVAYDSIFYSKYAVSSVPHILIIDPEGTIRAKVQNIDSLQLEKLMSGKKVNFRRSFSYQEPASGEYYNQSLPYLTNGKDANGGIDTGFLYRSLLAVSNQNTPIKVIDLTAKGYINHKQELQSTGRLEYLDVSLRTLYMSAYLGTNGWLPSDSALYGKMWEDIIFEGGLPKEFLDHFKYNYSLNIPRSKASREEFIRVMQNDLNNYFGFQARLEQRLMPVYLLEVFDKKKVTDFVHGKTQQRDHTFKGGILLDNQPFANFIQILANSLGKTTVLLNNTNIKGNVTLNFRADMFFAEKIIESLTNYGFIVKKELKEMSVLVVKSEIDDKLSKVTD